MNKPRARPLQIARAWLLVLLGLAEVAAAIELQRPRGLERDIDFWRRIFAEVSNDEGLVHDDQRLDIVYEIIRLPDNHTNAQRREASAQSTRKYVELLNGLARGRRAELTADERRILALWGPEVDSDTLAAAAQRVRFQLGQADRFRAGLVRSGRWERYIERTLAEAGVPPELIALPHVESGFDPSARSHAGAAGMWQFMPGTARDYMRLDAVVDERLDPYRSTDAAARLLRHNYGVTGSWPTAITAYNHGAGGMRRAIEQTGTRDIETIVRQYRGRAFGFASRNFYVSFLAASEVRSNAERYFGQLQREAPDPSVALEMPDYAPVEALEEVLRLDRATLARYNPSLRAPVWDGSRHIPRGHRLYVPPQPGLDPVALLAAMPAQRWSRAQIADQFHVVRPGETLSTIAPRYGTRVADLAALNGLSNANRIRIGQRLVLPDNPRAVAAAHTAAASRAPDVAVRMTGADAAAAPAVAAPPAAPAGVPDQLAVQYAVAPDGSIRVFEGESFAHYARWLGVSVDAIRRHNGLSATVSLRLGQTLKLPIAQANRVAFEQRRIDHHRQIRGQFLARHRIEGTLEHQIRPGESAWVLAERRYRIPVWLLREYNPGLDLNAVRPGTRLVIPRVVRVTG
jgi:membrane-bound lytic murein transglycosylase D